MAEGKVVGFDVALWRTGWAVGRGLKVTDGGALEPPKRTVKDGGRMRSLRREEVLAYLYQGVQALLARLSKVATEDGMAMVVVLEKPGGWARASRRSSQDTVEALAAARGAVMAAAGCLGIRCVEIAVGEARRKVFGRSDINKDGVQFALKALGVPILMTVSGEVDGDYCDAALLVVAYSWPELPVGLPPGQLILPQRSRHSQGRWVRGKR